MPTAARLLAPLGLMFLAACGDGEGQYGEDAMASIEEGAAPENNRFEYCPLTKQVEPIGECERLAEQYADLDAGVDAFRPDAQVREYEPVVIRYAITRLPDSVQGEDGEVARPIAETEDDSIDPVEPAEALPSGPTQAEYDAALAEAGEAVTAAIEAETDDEDVTVREIKMGRNMQACLDADATFELDEETRCQTIDTFQKPVAIWRWTVRPTDPGNHTLVVQSSVELTASDGTPRYIPQRGQDARTTVEVTAYGRWKRFLTSAEEWVRSPIGLIAALTALAGAIGLLIGAIKRARRGEGPPAPKT